MEEFGRHGSSAAMVVRPPREFSHHGGYGRNGRYGRRDKRRREIAWVGFPGALHTGLSRRPWSRPGTDPAVAS